MRTFITVFLLIAGFASAPSFADAPLATRLQLSVEQAKQVNELQAGHRKIYASKRQVHNRELRALRRAKLANDSAEIARLTALTDSLQAELVQLRLSADQDITQVLNPDQLVLFEGYIAERQQMHGSSRDERIHD